MTVVVLVFPLIVSAGGVESLGSWSPESQIRSLRATRHKAILHVFLNEAPPGICDRRIWAATRMGRMGGATLERHAGGRDPDGKRHPWTPGRGPSDWATGPDEGGARKASDAPLHGRGRLGTFRAWRQCTSQAFCTGRQSSATSQRTRASIPTAMEAGQLERACGA